MGAVGQELRVKGVVTTVNYRVTRKHIVSLIKLKVIGNVIYEKSRPMYRMVAGSQAHRMASLFSTNSMPGWKTVCIRQLAPSLFEKCHDSYWASTTKIKTP